HPIRNCAAPCRTRVRCEEASQAAETRSSMRNRVLPAHGAAPARRQRVRWALPGAPRPKVQAMAQPIPPPEAGSASGAACRSCKTVTPAAVRPGFFSPSADAQTLVVETAAAAAGLDVAAALLAFEAALFRAECRLGRPARRRADQRLLQ